MKESRNLVSVLSDIDVVGAKLEQVQKLIELLDEEIEKGLNSDDEAWKAVCFVRRIPMQIELIRAIERDIERRSKELDCLVSELVEVSKANREKETV